MKVNLPKETEPTKELTPEEKLDQAVNKERVRILTLLLSNRARQAGDYRNTIKFTGGLLTQSMVYAYSKGLEDAFKLISKNKEQDEKQDQKTS